ncbi:MAG: hypothetical protein K9W44_06635 [Candidatus Lokiarchaeota archaeon]|nr:hypothetical protein [Candidatus Harpocratesius repetitus]
MNRQVANAPKIVYRCWQLYQNSIWRMGTYGGRNRNPISGPMARVFPAESGKNAKFGKI